MSSVQTLNVPDMSCGHCVRAIEAAVHALDAQAAVACDLEAKIVRVTTAAPADAVLAAIRAAGYTPSA